jgi:archaellum component FlaG (FlaF/FlaG flagellin family)
MATVDYSIGGTPAQVNSNVSTVVVDELVNVTMALQSPTVSVAAGAANEALLFLVTNIGNGNEIFTLAGDSVLVGDDFDPSPAAPFIYFDSDSSGDLSPGDTPYVAGSNDPSLAADGSVAVLLVNDIPPGLPDG